MVPERSTASALMLPATMKPEGECMETNEEKRLFISLPMDAAWSAALESIQEKLKAEGTQGRFMKLKNLHITLAFIGETTKEAAIRAILEELPFPATTLQLTQMGNFGKLVYAGVQVEPALVEYVRQLKERLFEAGIPVDRKPFRPHITLMRACPEWKPVALPELTMRADTAELMLSEFTDDGMKYTPLLEIHPRE